MLMRRALPLSVALVLGAGTGIAYGQSSEGTDARLEREPESIVVPAPDDSVSIIDGRGGERHDLTYAQFQAAIERAEEETPADDGTMHLYGLVPDGGIGVIGVCREVAVAELDPGRRAVVEESAGELPGGAPEYIHDCSPAPGIEWPNE